jgi:hypothetical protein
VVEELQKSGARVKLHLLGDSKQMQGVQAGHLLAPLRGLGEKGEIDYAHLTEILRQRDPGLLQIAEGKTYSWPRSARLRFSLYT